MRKLTYLLILLFPLNSFAFDYCSKFKSDYTFADKLCNAGEKASVICTAALAITGPWALICAMPGAITHTACNRKERFRKSLDNCVEHEKKIAHLRIRHAEGLARQAAYIRPIIEKAIKDYYDIIHPSWDESAWRIEQIIISMPNATDEEKMIEVDKYLDWVDLHRPSVRYHARQKFEMFFSQYMIDIALEDYHEWDDYANECFIFAPPNPTRFSTRCLKAHCYGRNIFMEEGSAQPICEDLE